MSFRRSFVVPLKAYTVRQLLDMQSRGIALPKLTQYSLRDGLTNIIEPDFSEPITDLSQIFERTSSFSDVNEQQRQIQMRARELDSKMQKMSYDRNIEIQRNALEYSRNLNSSDNSMTNISNNVSSSNSVEKSVPQGSAE